MLITVATVVMGLNVPTVGDQGDLPESLPELLIQSVPLTWETLTIIAPYALAMALVGLLESLMTAKLVDEITDTRSRKTREAWAQGASNVLSGLFGGMGGCAMIGQTMINVKASGARTRISAIGVIVGVLAAMIVFARRVAHFATVERTLDLDDAVPTAYYTVRGELFFASSNDLTTQFEYAADPDRIVIDLSRSHVWDASTVAALDSITTAYEHRGKTVLIEGMNEASTQMHSRLAGNLGAGH